ncbi:MAG: pantoate--beta-alanine ligase [Chloroflexi bacterium]|nr:pantoate--beta-alanine ligase [Chloroflexota bacterium]
MQLTTTIKEITAWRNSLSDSLALVPTMGALHQGHISLIKTAKQLCSQVAVSIFVNPSQFAAGEDFDKYPRDFAKDEKLLKDNGVDMLFYPDAKEIYPDDFDTWVQAEKMSRILEGTHRPTHFKGVTTIVLKLFNIIRPQIVVLGQKDAQQVVIINKMVKDLNIPLQLHVVPTVRTDSGLALSSRNAYLLPKELKAASCLYEALRAGKKLFDEGYRQAGVIKQNVRQILQQEPLISHIDYVSLASLEDLNELNEISDAPALLSIAVKIGSTRLIDNIIM